VTGKAIIKCDMNVQEDKVKRRFLGPDRWALDRKEEVTSSITKGGFLGMWHFAHVNSHWLSATEKIKEVEELQQLYINFQPNKHRN